MKIIGSIPHPHLKISVFRNEGRLSLKFENEGYEITLKLGSDERLQSVADIEKWVDAPFLSEIMQQFQQIHGIRLRAMQRHFEQDEEFFEEII